MRNLLYAVSIIIALLCSCHRDPVWQTLNEAESIMEEHPDSALILLTKLDGNALRGEAKACHALLLSQAYDKNYIDNTDDSLISIALNYYNSTSDKRRQMLSSYYWAVVHMNRQDYDKALSVALESEKLASDLNEQTLLTQIKMLIARAYLFSYNYEGADEYLKQVLQLSYSLGNTNWVGLSYYNLANLFLAKGDFIKAIEVVDSAKKYMEYDADIASIEIFAHIRMNEYEQADSIYAIIPDIIQNSPLLKAYRLLSHFDKTQTIDYDTLSENFANVTRIDSIDIAFIGNQIALKNGDYKQAWKYTDIMLQETNRVIADLSAHSLYRIQLEHNKFEAQRTDIELRSKQQLATFAIITTILVCLIGIIYILFLKRSQKAKILKFQTDALLLSSDFIELQKKNDLAVKRLQEVETQNTLNIHSLQEQVQAGKIAAQELFMDKFSWIEELGNIFLDSEVSKTTKNRAIRDIQKRLDQVKAKRFIPELIGIINRYRNNLINRIRSECPIISDSEIDIIALLCANLSPRIIGFILNIKLQSVYNAKSSIKKKLESTNPNIFHEMDDIFHPTR